jgi:hypothetical protein
MSLQILVAASPRCVQSNFDGETKYLSIDIPARQLETAVLLFLTGIDYSLSPARNFFALSSLAGPAVDVLTHSVRGVSSQRLDEIERKRILRNRKPTSYTVCFILRIRWLIGAIDNQQAVALV